VADHHGTVSSPSRPVQRTTRAGRRGERQARAQPARCGPHPARDTSARGRPHAIVHPSSPYDPAMTKPADRRRAVIVAGHRGDRRPALDGSPTPTHRPGRGPRRPRAHRGAEPEAPAGAGSHDPDPRCAAGRSRLVAALDGAGPAAEVPIVGCSTTPTTPWWRWPPGQSGERTPAEPDAVARLVALATDADDALVREAAVAALGAIGDPPASRRAAATGDKATVRRRAVIALAAFGGPRWMRPSNAPSATATGRSAKRPKTSSSTSVRRHGRPLRVDRARRGHGVARLHPDGGLRPQPAGHRGARRGRDT
jgi:hypothetical protein